ncbi:CpaF family protein [Kocuria sp.]|uniref:CpaF family protein n=1 Tax=Kocuria sp. TaxID=1871328 RepID=UPI0026E0535B|nr:ATPase, T2SS/T4P/T4SS family [Kocuria sp.]MDO5619603.1 ATPase, T2SS/T4P/T4SS family [Kocuria sp.]
MAQLTTRSSRRHVTRTSGVGVVGLHAEDAISSEEQAFSWVLDTVRERVRLQGLDPVEAPAEAASIIEAVLQDYDQASARTGLASFLDLDATRTEIMDAVAGFGVLQPLLDDDSVEEIWINGPDQIFVARGGESELTGLRVETEEIRRLVERMLRRSGRRLDLSSPFVDASLPDGSRLHVVIPDVTREHWSVNIRKFIVAARRLSDLIGLGSLSPAAAGFLGASVRAGLNILVSGATQAGKTTMLNCLCAEIDPRQRVVTVEEIFELQVPLRDVVGMQCRQPNLEGTGEIALRRLVKEALRMRPDRLIVGEVREAESLDMLIALNSGLPGMCSIHANSAKDAVTKICTLPLLAGENISSNFVVPTVASSFDLVVHCRRRHDGLREVEEIRALGNRVENGIIETYPVFQRVDGDLVAVTGEIPARHKFEVSGVATAGVLEVPEPCATEARNTTGPQIATAENHRGR